MKPKVATKAEPSPHPMGKEHELELVRRVARQDRHAFEELYTLYYRRLFGPRSAVPRPCVVQTPRTIAASEEHNVPSVVVIGHRMELTPRRLGDGGGGGPVDAVVLPSIGGVAASVPSSSSGSKSTRRR